MSIALLDMFITVMDLALSLQSTIYLMNNNHLKRPSSYSVSSTYSVSRVLGWGGGAGEGHRKHKEGVLTPRLGKYEEVAPKLRSDG